MPVIPPHLLLLLAWSVTFLSARVSPELASAINSAVWMFCAAYLLRGSALRSSMRMTLSGLSALAIALLWLVDSYSLVDPYSARSWLLGWAAPLLAAFVMARREEVYTDLRHGLARIGALLGFACVMLWFGGAERASALFANPNICAAVLVGCLPCVAVVKGRSEQALLLFAMVLGLAATGSRGGLLAVSAMAVWVVVIRRGDRRVLIAAVLLAMVSVPFAISRLQKLADDPYASGRSLWWRAAWRVSKEQPAGVGTRQFGWHGLRQRNAVKAPVYRYLRGHAGESAHSEWVQLGVDHGPLGPLFLLVASLALLGLRAKRLEQVALLGILVHALVDGTWQSEVLRMLLLMHAMALWRHGPALPWRFPAPVALGLMIAAVVATLPAGAAQVAERSALRFDRLAQRQGRVDERSLQRLQRAAALNPGDPDPLAAGAGIYARVGRWEAAFEAIEAAVKRAPARPGLRRLALDIYLRAQASAAGGRNAGLASLTHAHAAVRLQPMHAVDRFGLAEAAQRLGQSALARKQLQLALGLEPNFRVAWLALAAMEPLNAEQHVNQAKQIRSQLLARYCPKGEPGCRDHLRRVMTRLELRLVGDLGGAQDVIPVMERFAFVSPAPRR
jgi:tetratricopeptide (TPR) repeat protein